MCHCVFCISRLFIFKNVNVSSGSFANRVRIYNKVNGVGGSLGVPFEQEQDGLGREGDGLAGCCMFCPSPCVFLKAFLGRGRFGEKKQK